MTNREEDCWFGQNLQIVWNESENRSFSKKVSDLGEGWLRGTSREVLF